MSSPKSCPFPAVGSKPAPANHGKVVKKPFKFDRSLITVSLFLIIGLYTIPAKYANAQHAATKPFNTFDEFYPFYISQHQDVTCRRLHIIGTSIIIMMTLAEPFIVPSLLMAALTGYVAFTATVSLEHGIVEIVLMMGAFLFYMKKFTGSWLKGLMVPLVAYTFAWVGHFYFEHNKPATFIYPMYSLAGDFRMMFETLSGERAF